MSNKLSGTLTLRLPSGDNRFKAFFNVGESGFATEEYVKQLIAELENKEEGKYVEKIDIQDTLNSDNSNKPLSANQGKVLKGLLDAKVIEAGAVPMDSEPTEGNINNVVSSDGLAKEFNKSNTEIVLGGIYDVSAHNNGAVFESLSALLSSPNLATLIPTSVRHGGMSIRFVQSSDNTYVQYRLMSNSFNTTPANWQGVDNEPTAGSNNLIKSGEVFSSISKLYQSTASEQIEKGTIGGSQLKYETRKIRIADNVEYYVQVSNITNPEMYIIWSDGTFLRIHNNVWLKMTYPSEKTFGYIRIFGDTSGMDIDVKVLQNSVNWKNVFIIPTAELVAKSEIKKYGHNIQEIRESGISIGNAFNTKEIKLSDGDSFIVESNYGGEMYIIWSDNSFLRIPNNVWLKMTYPSEKTFGNIRVVTDSGNDVSVKVIIRPKLWEESSQEIAEEISIQNTQDLENSIIESKVLITEKNRNSQIYSDYLKKGNTIVIEVLGASSGDAEQDGIGFYGFLENGTYDTLWEAPKGGYVQKEIILSKDYQYINAYAIPSIVQYNYKISITSFLYNDVKRLETQIGMGSTIPMRVLVLGDSYSQNGGNWCDPMIKMLPQGSSYISLAVSSATIKDRYADRAIYPYTSRPVSTDNAGNHNTLACQIEKLKRLMQGTDLDDGETAIYQSAEEYPNVIIIEGGINDSMDTEEKVSTYHSQLDKIVENVYRKRKSSDTEATLGSITIKTPLDEVDRTCFAGAYRYLADELLQLFPNAQIYITTCSPLDYRNGNMTSVQTITKAEQQRLCSDIFAFNLIDWHRDGQINSIINYAKGKGTESEPYIWGGLEGEYVDTNDQLHPNARGGKKYGRLAALRIKQTFLNIGDLL